MKIRAMGLVLITFVVLAPAIFADEDGFDIQNFIGKPTTGGIICMTQVDAHEVATFALAADQVGLQQKLVTACGMADFYIPTQVASRPSDDLMILEVRAGEYATTAYVVATPAALRPLEKAGPPKPIGPPARIPQGHWQ